MNAYLAAMKAALLAGFYVPELEIVYTRHDLQDRIDSPRALALDFGY